MRARYGSQGPRAFISAAAYFLTRAPPGISIRSKGRRGQFVLLITAQLATRSRATREGGRKFSKKYRQLHPGPRTDSSPFLPSPPPNSSPLPLTLPPTPHHHFTVLALVFLTPLLSSLVAKKDANLLMSKWKGWEKSRGSCMQCCTRYASTELQAYGDILPPYKIKFA